MHETTAKPKVAVHKFSSCDGCQLAFLDMGEDLLTLSAMVDIVHFAEAGMLDEETPVDVAFVEGSLNTRHDLERIRKIRDNSRFLVTIGACATAGGLQALRNFVDDEDWHGAVYASPEYLDSLATASPIRSAVHVDLELWGCPVNTRQVKGAVRALLSGVTPAVEQDKVCMECKRKQAVCVMVAQGTPCMGPVTRTGCGALCPSFERGCYACYGPAENPNTDSLSHWFEGLGLLPEQLREHYHGITNQAEPFTSAGNRYRK